MTIYDRAPPLRMLPKIFYSTFWALGRFRPPLRNRLSTRRFQNPALEDPEKTKKDKFDGFCINFQFLDL
jgi:hypothetical protein